MVIVKAVLMPNALCTSLQLVLLKCYVISKAINK